MLGGTFAIGGHLPVRRLGYGSMRLTGPGVWGEPKDHDVGGLKGRQPLAEAPTGVETVAEH